jgi:diadenosine tetraphosphate (Ap4A) HIT family hydrolase
MELSCPFCLLPADRVVDSSQHWLVVRDGFPISPGHTLIIAKRHIGSFFDLSADEQVELVTLMCKAKDTLVQKFHPQGFNIGINDGPAAGQTVPHLHVHLIPRYTGDKADPRGGVRWIIPEKADYWSKK